MSRRPQPTNIDKFIDFLRKHGVEFLTPTSQSEAFRFRSGDRISSIYVGKKGYSLSDKAATKAYEAFRDGSRWYGRPFKKKRRQNGRSKRQELIARDGNTCFFCGNEFEQDQLTNEHLLPITQGGVDTLNNMVLACRPCNEKVGYKTLPEKILARDEMRANNE